MFLTGSPKDRGRIEGWNSCPSGYVYPSDAEILAVIDTGLQQLKSDFSKPLRRKGAGGQVHRIWRSALDVTAKDPLLLTKIAKRKVGM